jgi:hypothetical protein
MLEVDAGKARAGAGEARVRLAAMEMAAAARSEEARRLNRERAAGLEGAVRPGPEAGLFVLQARRIEHAFACMQYCRTLPHAAAPAGHVRRNRRPGRCRMGTGQAVNLCYATF